MQRNLIKSVFVVLLLATIVWIWMVAITYYRAHKTDIILALEDTAREIALPYRIALLSLREPETRLPVPVYGVPFNEISDTWGEARAAGRTHEGTDIFAERGTPVFSATEGYVIRVNIGTLGGENIMVAGPGGVRYYYAHFTRIANGIERGAYVTSDTVLGFVGNTGNAAGTPPHLHFGIYVGRREAVNPHPFLVNR